MSFRLTLRLMTLDDLDLLCLQQVNSSNSLGISRDFVDMGVNNSSASEVIRHAGAI